MLNYGYKRWSTNREPHRAYTQPVGISYLVGTVCRGRSNFVNFWTKLWPAEQPRATSDSPDRQFLTYSRAWRSVFFFFGSVVWLLRNNPLSSKTVHTSRLFASVKWQQQTIFLKWLRQALHCPSYSTLVTRSLQIHRHWTLFLVQKKKKILDSTNGVSSKSIENRPCACTVERHEQTGSRNLKAPLQIMKTLLELKCFFCCNKGTLWAYFYF